tara:strand:+ start:197 stop:775 length:579 start_codon:yes stop_codon:yes gene_type:complete
MATLSSKVTPSGVATAAQGALADAAVQPNDSPTFVTLTLTDQLEVENASPSIRLRETDIPNAQHRIIASSGGLYIQAEDTDGTTDGDLYLTGMNSQDARLIDMRAATVTMTNDLEVTGDVQAATFTGDGSALTGIAAGATGGGNDDIFYENGQNVTTNYTITNGKNAMSAGPITIDNGVTVTVGAGETWTVI